MDPSGAKGLSRHKMVLRNFYIEPKDEEITVTFLSFFFFFEILE